MRRARVDQLPVISGNRRLVGMLFDRELIKVLLPERQDLRKS
jgi:CBS domain-containing protein